MDMYEGQENLPEIYQYSTVMDALMEMNERRVNELIVVGKADKKMGVIKRDDIFYFYTRENMISRKQH